MIRLENVRFGYGEEAILKQLNFAIDSRELVGIVGESGSGKTTLSQLLLGIEAPDAGKMTLNLRSVLPIFQHAYDSFNPKLRLEQSMNEPIRYYVKQRRENVQTRMLELMTEMDVPHALLEKYPDEVSGGQLQRMNVIRTLMLEPDMIVCDEITSSLDVVAERRMLSMLQHYYEAHQRAMVIISHDLAVLYQIVQRFIVLKDGVIVDDFETGELFSEERHSYTKELLSLYVDVE